VSVISRTAKLFNIRTVAIMAQLLVGIAFSAGFCRNMDLDFFDRLDAILEVSVEPLASIVVHGVPHPGHGVGIATSAAAAAAAELDVADFERLQQLGLRRQPAAKPKAAPPAQRSCELLVVARGAKATKKRAADDAKVASEKAADARELQMVATLVPSIAKSLGLRHAAKRSRINKKEELSPEQSKFLVRASFQSSIPRGLGVRHSRLQAFACQLALEAQDTGLAKLIWQCAAFRQNAEPGMIHIAVLGVSFESDSTTQKLAQHLIQAVGRPAKRRLDTEVVNQRGVVRICLMKVHRATGKIADETIFSVDWHSRSCVIMGKTAPYILKAFEKGLPFEWEHVDRRAEWFDAMVDAFDVRILDIHCDKGSSNGPAVRHVASVFCEVAGNMADASCCELHTLQHIKNSLPEVKRHVGRMYSLSNVSRSASFHDNLIHCIVAIVHTSVHRLIQPPPPEARSLEKLLDRLYQFDAEHHKRRSGQAESTLLSDLRMLAQLPLLDAPRTLGVQGRLHYCHNPVTLLPCCDSDDECHEKISVANINFFCSSAFDKVCLARWTHVSKCRKRLIVGMSNQRLFLSALSFAAKKVAGPTMDVPTLPSMTDVTPEEMGAMEGDYMTTHVSRCTRLASWVGGRPFYFELPIMEATECHLDTLEYAFFGKDKKCIGVAALLHRETSPIGQALGSLWRMTMEFRNDDEGLWAVLPLSGWRDFKSEDVRLCARRHTLSLSAGLVQKYDGKFGSLPWTMYRGLDDTWPQEDQEAVFFEIVQALPCNLPLMAAQFLDQFATIPQMRSPHARAVLTVLFAGKHLTTKLSELGHSSERRDLHSANAPGKVFGKHSRRDLLNRSTDTHVYILRSKYQAQ
jgi:hypothetical protein